ncbi:MAG: flagellar filament capping protein FliD [Nitrospinae bacterium]|nr:flagellar filament capping protein FliD [Nitrospinota bacterium]
MIRDSIASYWSATADVGRALPLAAPESKGSASYWSATADTGIESARSMRDAVAEAVFYNRRGLPHIDQRGDAASAYRVQQTLADLEGEKFTPMAERNLAIKNTRSLSGQSDFFAAVRQNLGALGSALDDLASPDSLNPRVASSTDPAKVTAVASSGAATGSHTITVTRLARQHELASTEQADSHAALGLTGTVKVNGYAIAVSASDSLADIRDRINYGEDTNKNGKLDINTEDANGNGSLDHYFSPAVYAGASGYLPSFNYFEDINGDGQINTGEDINDSKSLDGGTAATRAAASIRDNRLIIKNLRGASSYLSLKDPDGILETLGFLKRGQDNVTVMKTAMDEPDYNMDPQTARYTLDGAAKQADFNEISGVIEGITLTLKAVTEREVAVNVANDASGPVEKVSAFVDAYNGAIRTLNAREVNHTQPKNNVRAQDLVIALARDSMGPVASRPEPPRSLADIGARAAEYSSKGIDIAALENMLGPLSRAELVNAAGGEPGLFGDLSRVGVSTQNDFTLTLDKATLARAIESSPGGVYDVFNAETDGVGTRLRKTIDHATGIPNGMIEYQLEIINRYKDKPDEVARLLAATTGVNPSKTTQGGPGAVDLVA